jgi:hypothetical protein
MSDTTILAGILHEVRRDRITVAAGTSIAVPPNVLTQDVPVGSTVRVIVTRSERGEWVAREIEHEPRRNGRGRT